MAELGTTDETMVDARHGKREGGSREAGSGSGGSGVGSGAGPGGGGNRKAANPCGEGEKPSCGGGLQLQRRRGTDGPMCYAGQGDSEGSEPGCVARSKGPERPVAGSGSGSTMMRGSSKKGGIGDDEAASAAAAFMTANNSSSSMSTPALIIILLIAAIVLAVSLIYVVKWKSGKSSRVILIGIDDPNGFQDSRPYFGTLIDDEDALDTLAMARRAGHRRRSSDTNEDEPAYADVGDANATCGELPGQRRSSGGSDRDGLRPESAIGYPTYGELEAAGSTLPPELARPRAARAKGEKAREAGRHGELPPDAELPAYDEAVAGGAAGGPARSPTSMDVAELREQAFAPDRASRSTSDPLRRLREGAAGAAGVPPSSPRPRRGSAEKRHVVIDDDDDFDNDGLPAPPAYASHDGWMGGGAKSGGAGGGAAEGGGAAREPVLQHGLGLDNRPNIIQFIAAAQAQQPAATQAPRHTTAPALSDAAKAGMVTQVMQMGFDEAAARGALEARGWNLEAAINAMLGA